MSDEKNNPPQGLGDSIESFLTKTGVKNIVERIEKYTNRDCGCNKRKEILNKNFPYYSKKNK